MTTTNGEQRKQRVEDATSFSAQNKIFLRGRSNFDSAGGTGVAGAPKLRKLAFLMRELQTKERKMDMLEKGLRTLL